EALLGLRETLAEFLAARERVLRDLRRLLVALTPVDADEGRQRARVRRVELDRAEEDRLRLVHVLLRLEQHPELEEDVRVVRQDLAGAQQVLLRAQRVALLGTEQTELLEREPVPRVDGDRILESRHRFRDARDLAERPAHPVRRFRALRIEGTGALELGPCLVEASAVEHRRAETDGAQIEEQ